MAMAQCRGTWCWDRFHFPKPAGYAQHVDHEAGVLVAAAPEDTLRFHMLALGALRRIPVASCQNPKATKTYIFKFRLKFEPRTKKDPRI